MPAIPYSRHLTVAALAAVVTIGTLVLLSLSSPAPSPGANVVVIGNERYSYENVTVFGPSWSNFTYEGMAFSFHVWCGPVTPGGATLCGNVTGPGGAAYPFSFFEPGGPPPTQPKPWVTWISPNGLAGVQFEPDSGGLAHLLVRM